MQNIQKTKDKFEKEKCKLNTSCIHSKNNNYGLVLNDSFRNPTISCACSDSLQNGLRIGCHIIYYMVLMHGTSCYAIQTNNFSVT